MFRMLTAVFLVAALSVTAVFAQITINQGNVRSVNSTYVEYETDGVTCNHGSGGANQTWSVPQQTWQYTTPEWWVAPSSTPYAADFPTATHASTDPTLMYFSYMRVAANGVSALGFVTTQADTPWVVHFTSEPLYLPFPLTYNTSWTTVLRYSINYFGQTFTFSDSSTHLADGWGNMTTPLAETYAALRVISREFQWQELNGIPAGPVDDRYAYMWLMQDGTDGVRMKQTSDAPGPDPNFTVGDLYVSQYTGQLAADQPRGPVADRFSIGQNYPNPFNPTTTLPVELQHTAKVTLSVYDETGRLVSTQEMELPAGSHNLPIDGSNWATGAYFARVNAEGQSLSTKMTLIK